jgi:hypothetical protein
LQYAKKRFLKWTSCSFVHEPYFSEQIHQNFECITTKYLLQIWRRWEYREPLSPHFHSQFSAFPISIHDFTCDHKFLCARVHGFPKHKKGSNPVNQIRLCRRHYSTPALTHPGVLGVGWCVCVGCVWWVCVCWMWVLGVCVGCVVCVCVDV